jgi:integrase
MGVRDDGRYDRRHVRGANRAEVTRKVRDLEKARDTASSRAAGQRWTVATWLEYWLGNIAVPPHVAENTHAGYRVDVCNHLIPGIGAHRLEKLSPEHVERLYARLSRGGLGPGGVHHVHRTLRAALNEAVRRSHLARNPVLLAKAPKLAEMEVEPYGVEEVQRLLQAATSRRNSARWAVALALGLRRARRSGCAGKMWTSRTARCVSADRGCGRSTCTAAADPAGRSRGNCPERVNARPATGDVKSKAGRRTIGLPPQLVTLLRIHQAEQRQERAIAQDLWHDEGWVFATSTGEPVKSHTDYREWKRLLRDAGLREARLHDARHTAATVLLILGVPARTVMSLMGWSSAEMAARYQHVTDTVRHEVARQVDSLIWHARSEADAAAPTEDGALVPVDRRSLAVALNLAELGLAHVDQSTAGPARCAVEQLRALVSEAAAESSRGNTGEEN